MLNTELAKINQWIQCNRLSLNIEKTNYMIMAGPRNKVYHENCKISINGQNIIRVYKIPNSLVSLLMKACLGNTIWNTFVIKHRNVSVFFLEHGRFYMAIHCLCFTMHQSSPISYIACLSGVIHRINICIRYILFKRR